MKHAMRILPLLKTFHYFQPAFLVVIRISIGYAKWIDPQGVVQKS